MEDLQSYLCIQMERKRMEIIQEKKAYKLGSGWTGSEVKWADLNMPAVRVFRIKSIQLDECKLPLRQQTELG